MMKKRFLFGCLFFTLISWSALATPTDINHHTKAQLDTKHKDLKNPPSGMFYPLTGTGNVHRSALSFNYLQTAAEPASLVHMSAFSLPPEAAHPRNQFSGKLTLFGEATFGNFYEVKDSFNFTNNHDSPRKHLPEFEYEFIQHGSHLVPVQRGILTNDHPDWEYILEPGRVWDERADNGYSRAVIPFSLQERNANCLHNGLMTFAFNNDGSITHVAYQIVSETCLYFKFDMWGLLAASYSPATVHNASSIIEYHQMEMKQRLPSKSFEQLAIDYPEVASTNFSDGVSSEHMSLFGFYIDGTNYVGGCRTRQGDYPFCNSLRVPSYSTAKSNFAGVALMRLEQKYGNVFNQTVAKYVSHCSENDQWRDVTLENTLDMATGNYDELAYMSDEAADHTNKLFFSEDHSSKIEYACSQYPRKTIPGRQWNYHTSDTYIIGTAMNTIIKQKETVNADIFNDVIVEELWRPLHIGQSTLSTRRTYDDRQQPFTGWGLTYNSDDVVKLAKFLAIDKGMLNGQQMLHLSELNAALQMNSRDRGLAPANGLLYKNGFWAKDLSAETGCSDMWIPFMSGYGGITIALLPNHSIYYYFSDNNEFSWTGAALGSHSIKSFCPDHAN